MTVVTPHQEDSSQHALHLEVVREAVRLAVNQLPEPEQSVIVGIMFEQKTRAQVAQQLGKDVWQIDYALMRAWKHLEAIIERMRHDRASNPVLCDALNAFIDP